MQNIYGWKNGDVVDLYQLGSADNDYTRVEFTCTDAGSGTFTGTLPTGVSLDDLTYAVYNATLDSYVYSATPDDCYFNISPKVQASTDIKDVIVMTAIKSVSGFTMKVVNNIVKVTNPTSAEIEAAWKWIVYPAHNYYATKMAIQQNLNEKLGYLIESIDVPGNFKNAKFALKADSDNYLFLIPGVTNDFNHKIGLSSNTDAANNATLMGLKNLADISATGGKCYSVMLDDLSKTGTANCYIVSAAGKYKFRGNVKGNSLKALNGTPVSADVLWESFGTSTAPSVGDIVNNVSFADGYVHFTATGAKGNAVIAVRDASSNILWSWHIWCTDQPAVQIYNYDAGHMMDRNLGATSATPGDVKALGLLYQWGRKDPFLGSSSISSGAERAASTLSWPKPGYPDVPYGLYTGGRTVEQSIANPTTFIIINEKWETHWDWDYDSHFSDIKTYTRWQSTKTIYDPCPPGWRVPAGNESGVWSTAFGGHIAWVTPSNWDSKHKGMNFGSTDITLGTGTIWYPATGQINCENGNLDTREYGWHVGESGLYWSCTCEKHQAFSLIIDDIGEIYPKRANYWSAYGRAVRCVRD